MLEPCNNKTLLKIIKIKLKNTVNGFQGKILGTLFLTNQKIVLLC